MAMTGYVDQISRSLIQGWASNTINPRDPAPKDHVLISIHVNGLYRGTCVASDGRDDVARASPGGIEGAIPGVMPAQCGFRFEFDPPLSPFAAQRIEVVDTRSGELLPGGTRTLPRPMHDGMDGGMRPIVVTSTGRSGTTWLMRQLSAHPLITTGDRYPYEIKQIAYHAAAFRALVAEADRERATHPDTMLAIETRRVIGANPYHQPGLFDMARPFEQLRDYYERRIPSKYAALFRTLILEFYGILARSQGKMSARFFCEKGDINEAAGQAARLFFGAMKENVVVRDPRDLLCSAMAFWKLHAEEALEMLRSTIPQLTRTTRAAGADTLVIRYEDMVRNPKEFWTTMSDFLNLDLTAQTRSNDGAMIHGHSTSADPLASIGRWKQDLPPDLIQACDIAFRPFMRDHGYELSDRSTPRTRQLASPIVAEGPEAVSAWLADSLLEHTEGGPGRRVMELTFGSGEIGTFFTGDGWSSPEDGFVWTHSGESTIHLPPVHQQGTNPSNSYQLRFVAAPFTHGSILPSQRIGISLNGHDAGMTNAAGICVLVVAVPAGLAMTRAGITVTLRLPDAACPRDIGAGTDDRMLGFSLRRLMLVRMAATLPRTTPSPIPHIPWAEAMSA